MTTSVQLGNTNPTLEEYIFSFLFCGEMNYTPSSLYMTEFIEYENMIDSQAQICRIESEPFVGATL
jgi:hypothetical protein